MNLDEIKLAIARRYAKCESRIQFYTYSAQILKLFGQTKLVKYVVGAEILNIAKEHSSDLQSLNRNKLKELDDSYGCFKECVKNI